MLFLSKKLNIHFLGPLPTTISIIKKTTSKVMEQNGILHLWSIQLNFNTSKQNFKHMFRYYSQTKHTHTHTHTHTCKHADIYVYI